MILSDVLMLPISQHETRQVMTSQTKSHIQCSMYYRCVIFFCSFCSPNWWKI